MVPALKLFQPVHLFLKVIHGQFSIYLGLHKKGMT